MKITVDGVLSALKRLGDTPEDIRSSLKALGIPTDVCGRNSRHKCPLEEFLFREFGVDISVRNNLFIIVPGTNPKVTLSAPLREFVWMWDRLLFHNRPLWRK